MSSNFREEFWEAQKRDKMEAQAKRDAGLARQRASREEGKERRRLRNLERGALGRARSTSERRRIKEEIAQLQAANKRRAEEERGRTEEGAIYDVKTHEEPTDNSTSSKQNINDNGIDEISGEQAAGDATGTTPGGGGDGGGGGGGGIPDGFAEETLTICVNGSPQARVFLTST